jgi:hypothetical protein
MRIRGRAGGVAVVVGGAWAGDGAGLGGEQQGVHCLLKLLRVQDAPLKDVLLPKREKEIQRIGGTRLINGECGLDTLLVVGRGQAVR